MQKVLPCLEGWAQKECVQIQHDLNSCRESLVAPEKLDECAVQDNVEYCLNLLVVLHTYIPLKLVG